MIDGNLFSALVVGGFLALVVIYYMVSRRKS